MLMAMAGPTTPASKPPGMRAKPRQQGALNLQDARIAALGSSDHLRARESPWVSSAPHGLRLSAREALPSSSWQASIPAANWVKEWVCRLRPIARKGGFAAAIDLH
jgi:hypothetical protein